MTNVHFTYTPSLNVAVSTKGTVTLWTTGQPAGNTTRLDVSTAQGATASNTVKGRPVSVKDVARTFAAASKSKSRK